jgi:hypothetical protein
VGGVAVSGLSRAGARKGWSARLAPLIAGLGVSLVGAGCRPIDGAPDPLPGDLRDRIERLYERARDAGEDVPSDALDWARADLERIGDWEYRVIRLAAGSDAELEAELDALGDDRWEVFWLEAVEEEGFRVFLKRSARSYLRMVPLGELGRLAPDGAE